MNENLNLAEILKDCPEGTKLYSPIYGDVELVKVIQSDEYPIQIKLNNNSTDEFTKEGRIFEDMSGLIDYLNADYKRILSTLGSKELPLLSSVNSCFERVWLRVLPAEGIIDYCKSYGFDENKIIIGKGPFSTDENIAHIKKSGAEILVTKESGRAGGYPEKVMAAKQLRVELATVKRPEETGFNIEKIKEVLMEIK